MCSVDLYGFSILVKCQGNLMSCLEICCLYMVNQTMLACIIIKEISDWFWFIMQLLVITYGAVGVYNHQVVVLHGACDDHQTSLFPPQCCFNININGLSFFEWWWACLSNVANDYYSVAFIFCGYSKSGHEGCICSVWSCNCIDVYLSL